MDKSSQVIAMYLLVHIGLIFFTYPADVIASLSVGHWSAILLGFACHFTLLGIYTKGLSRFASQNLIDIFRGTGKAFAVVLLFPVMAYLFMTMVVTVRVYAEIITVVFIGNTPIWSVMLLVVAVCALISSFGVESLFRTGVLVAILFLPLLLAVFILSFQNADWRYLLPLIDERSASFSYVFRRPYLLSQFAFAGGFVFLGFIPSYIPYERRKVVRASFLLLPLFLISVYIPLLTFGEDTAARFQFPFIMAVDTVDVSWLMFDRVTVFFMISLICFVLLYLSLAMWKTVLLLRSGIPLIRPVQANASLAAVLYIVCALIPDWESVERLLGWNLFLLAYVTMVIPLVTFLLGLRRERMGAARP
ncbi:GerAB/ArcD/ProY family transporter [Cohnella caldifontis]|uniref:GerAB/ArcD/ProY family transporter n=1 Tax=Cohnella caldifontis TaxID=3027471 RepID=UPI0023EB9819|nr:GerAB/ArcD/ProY family transporter [Cohnella sp. YIM B05605]